MDSSTALRNNSSAVTSRRNSYELGDFETGQQWSEQNHEVQSLPRADGGKDAWSLLGACFLLEALVWGFPFSFGIFQDYYINKNLFEGNEGGITAIGTTATGLMYFAASFVAVAGQRWPQYRRPTMLTGAALIVLSLIGASFCNTVAGLLATEGVLYAIGGVITYFPAIQYIDEWFIMKKGLAYGVVWAGTGSAGIVVPFFSQWLLDSFGFRTTLRVWAIILAVMMAPALYFIKGRVPVSGSSALRPVDLGYMKRAAFWVFWISIMFEGKSNRAGVSTATPADSDLAGLGYFVPTYWLPSFARSLNVPSFVGPLGLALYNVAVVVGAVSMGALVDHCHAGTAMLVSTVGQMLAIFVFWGLTSTQPMLYVFALIWGVFSGSWAATWTGAAAAIRSKEPTGSNMDITTVIALFAAAKGVGSVISGPLSEKLVDIQANWQAAYAYGSSYAGLIVFTGVAVTLGGLSWVGRLVRLV
ncbi:hypothetical protein D0863_06460 [Hortaea werneckii]|uniref:Major facilitator superfamily (MFS) profile domain-containing protein n=1 Tax=Hortaea werneckii TaxID=91943 RepID=A0A3M7DYM7_HORWE|nr:hypothetical protein D0863_06460 [Hortaea werneckii]